jgi:hypothetical protein
VKERIRHTVDRGKADAPEGAGKAPVRTNGETCVWSDS